MLALNGSSAPTLSLFSCQRGLYASSAASTTPRLFRKSAISFIFFSVSVMPGISGVRGSSAFPVLFCPCDEVFEIIQDFFIGHAAIIAVSAAVDDFDVEIDHVEVRVKQVHESVQVKKTAGLDKRVNIVQLELF